MSTTKEVQISQVNVRGIADAINAAVDAGRTITINGDTPIASFEAEAAHAYLNGTLSYRVAAKAKGKTREVFVKVGHMVTISSEAPEDHGPAPHATVKPTASKRKAPAKPKADAPASAPAKVKGDKSPIPATVKGETGYLTVRTVDGHYRYAVTMDETKATLFAPGGSSERHSARAEKAGIKIAA